MANVMNIPELALHTATSAIKSAIAETETTLQQVRTSLARSLAHSPICCRARSCAITSG